MTSRIIFPAVLLSLMLGTACSTEEASEQPVAARVCTPGQQISCACAGTPAGGEQRCLSDGSGFGVCTCAGGVGGAGGSGGAPQAAGGSSGPAGASGAGGVFAGGAGGTTQGGAGVSSAGASGSGSAGGGAVGGSAGAPGGECALPYIDVTDQLHSTGVYKGSVGSDLGIQNNCTMVTAGGDALMKYHLDHTTKLTVSVKPQSGQTQLPGYASLQLICGTRTSELACVSAALSGSTPLQAVVPAGDVFIAVSGSNPGADFELHVAESTACTTNQDCGGATPHCDGSTGACVGCESSFDCTDPAAPACLIGSTWQCGVPTCKTAGDNTGPSVATPLTDNVTLPGQTNCVFTPRWYRFDNPNPSGIAFTVESMGDQLTLVLVYDAVGRLLGGSFSTWDPQVINIRRAPQGTYYVVTNTNQMYGTAFSIKAQSFKDEPCVSDSDCETTGSNQILQSKCVQGSGACVPLEGMGQLPDGSHCDTDDDCTSGACTYTNFVHQPGLNVCTHKCESDADCAPGLVCGNWRHQQYECLPKCTSTYNCPVNPNSTGAPNGDGWGRYSCDASTGHCQLPPF